MRTVAGARRGLGLWLWQRASAVVMALYLPAFALYAASYAPLDYMAWRALFAPLIVKVATLIFSAAALLHAWIGLREILLDYVHLLGVRLALYLVFGLLYAACFVWAAVILWGAA